MRAAHTMDSKYLKIAFILIFASFALVTIVFVFVLLLTRS